MKCVCSQQIPFQCCFSALATKNRGRNSRHREVLRKYLFFGEAWKQRARKQEPSTRNCARPIYISLFISFAFFLFLFSSKIIYSSSRFKYCVQPTKISVRSWCSFSGINWMNSRGAKKNARTLPTKWQKDACIFLKYNGIWILNTQWYLKIVARHSSPSFDSCNRKFSNSRLRNSL